MVARGDRIEPPTSDFFGSILREIDAADVCENVFCAAIVRFAALALR